MDRYIPELEAKNLQSKSLSSRPGNKARMLEPTFYLQRNNIKGKTGNPSLLQARTRHKQRLDQRLTNGQLQDGDHRTKPTWHNTWTTQHTVQSNAAQDKWELRLQRHYVTQGRSNLQPGSYTLGVGRDNPVPNITSGRSIGVNYIYYIKSYIHNSSFPTTWSLSLEIYENKVMSAMLEEFIIANEGNTTKDVPRQQWKILPTWRRLENKKINTAIVTTKNRLLEQESNAYDSSLGTRNREKPKGRSST